MEKLDIELDIIKCKIHEEDLQDDFKEKLEEKLNSACESRAYTTIKNNKKIISMPSYFYKSVAAVFICVFMFSSCAFAGGVGDWIKELFSNVDKKMEIAYENGDIKEVNTEYQTFDGVSLKVDYVSLKDNELYIVLDMENAEEHTDIIFKDFVIKDESSNIIFQLRNEVEKIGHEYKLTEKINTKSSSSIVLSVMEDDKFDVMKKINIHIKEIKFLFDNITTTKYGDWNFDINL